ncbi:MAG: 1,4-alpha-glucan branching protein GlgB [Dactylosporangium sp.]|nr:1,4-alpha-glucan branching protein GlgB [Dactylosporangium sp.]NNJ59767.1 1,4-alpha-glucan branching protein GlgB [Dactylosporangium sp.]
MTPPATVAKPTSGRSRKTRRQPPAVVAHRQQALIPPRPGDLDLHLFGEGRHERLWEVLGAHPYEGGTAFAVWAPNAVEVRVVGDTPGWGESDGIVMAELGTSGVWHAAVPGVGVGERYKYRIHCQDGTVREKADPMATATECPPATASVVYRSDHTWSDASWMRQRATGAPHHQRPMSIYEVHLGSWRPGLSYVEVADQLVEYVVDLGFTHIELMPVMEHPYGPSWGYQVTGYYAPTARFGTPDQFRYLVDRMHAAGIGVLLDWVPAHFPRDDWALARFDGTALYEHADPRRGEHPDWGSLVFNLGRHEVHNFLFANALYWLEEFHIDGLRVDAVASMLYLDYSRQPGQWVPNHHGGNEDLDTLAFLKELNTVVYREHPGAMVIAEESTAWPGVSRPVDGGGLGFGFKWNMGWMHDTLQYIGKDPVYRKYHQDTLTLPMLYAFSENYILPISHDEVVHGKGALAAKFPGDRWQRLAGLRGLLGYMWAFPGKQLLFMGAELALEHEWSEQQGLFWPAASLPEVAGVRRALTDLNTVYRAHSALWTQDTTPAGLGWIVGDAESNLVAFVRYDLDGSAVACLSNFSPIPRESYSITLPRAGRWTELINTDASEYGGTGTGNLGGLTTGEDGSVEIQIGPLTTIWLRHEPTELTELTETDETPETVR